MKATHFYGQDDQPRKKSLMAPIVQGLIFGGIVCGVLTALVAVLRSIWYRRAFSSMTCAWRITLSLPLPPVARWLAASPVGQSIGLGSGQWQGCGVIVKGEGGEVGCLFFKDGGHRKFCGGRDHPPCTGIIANSARHRKNSHVCDLPHAPGEPASFPASVKEAVTLLGKSRRLISNAMEVSFSRSISSVSLAFNPRRQDRFAAHF
jgi:hypothetical protein